MDKADDACDYEDSTDFHAEDSDDGDNKDDSTYSGEDGRLIYIFVNRLAQRLRWALQPL